MNPPPALRSIFSVYIRGLLVALIALLAVLTLALRHSWPLPALLEEITREPFAPRIAATPPGR